MASIYHPLSTAATITIIISVLISLSLPNAVDSSITSQELDSVISSLRSHNYNLFSNAILTSDILFDLQSDAAGNYTFFAPSDSSLFALDMISSASFYTQTLRYHIVPRRLSVADFRSINSESSLDTLLPRRNVQLSRPRWPDFDTFAVEGVEVAVPGLYYGRHVAVHGLDGILSFRPPVGLRHSSPLPRLPFLDNSSRTGNHSVHDIMNIPPVNQTVLPPSPNLSPMNSRYPFLQPNFHPSDPPVLSPLPESPTVNGVSPGHSPEISPVNRMVLPPSPNLSPMNSRFQILLKDFHPSDPTVVSPLPESSTVNGVSPGHSPEIPPVNRMVLPPSPNLSPMNARFPFLLPNFHPSDPTVVSPLPEPPTVNDVSQGHSPEIPPVNQMVLPPSPNLSPMNARFPFLLPKFHPSDPTVVSPLPEPPTVNGVSPGHSPEIPPAPGHQPHSPAPFIPEVSSPSMNDRLEAPDTNPNPMRSEKKFPEMTTNAAVSGIAGEFLASIPPAPRDETGADYETLAMKPEISWPSDEEQTVDNQVTGGETEVGHVSIQDDSHVGMPLSEL